MKLVYLVGVPGSGKTTLLDAALARLELPIGLPVPKPVPHVRYGALWYLGVRRGAFGGTDAMSMSIEPRARDWLGVVASQCEVLVGEGDRLATKGFLTTWPTTTVVYLDTPLSIARERAVTRAAELGRAPQQTVWWKGRVTKIDRLTATLPHHYLDGRRPLESLAGELVELIRP